MDWLDRIPQWLRVDLDSLTPNQRRRYRYWRQRYIATPPWADRAAMRRLYLRRMAGDVIDHIVPLLHPHVCGLHCPADLRIISAGENATKSNVWWPDMWAEQQSLDIDHQPHQQRLSL